MSGDPGQDFWDYSLTVYGREGVAPACLALQDRRGLDVNLLLFCGWSGAQGVSLEAAELAALDEMVRPWRRAVVQPLRGVRRWLKSQSLAPAASADALRERLLAEELRAEEIVQRVMATRLPARLDVTPPAPRGTSAPQRTAANLTTCLMALDVERSAADTADLAALLRGCHPEIAPLDAVWLLGG